MKTVAFTGHRAINGTYDGPLHVALRGELIETVRRAADNGFSNFISGMALGFDMLAAEAVLALKEQGYNINLIAAIPFPSQPNKWQDYQKRRYHSILNKIPANLRFMVDADPYAPHKLQKRNIWMIDRAQAVVAGWTGVKKGGTWNAIEYAINKGLPILVKHPTLYTEQWVRKQDIK